MDRRPIGVFDSGLGGLSVVRHLRRLLPGHEIVYFGDTARVPYGSKSRATVAAFALQTARFLLRFEPRLLVAACNTASALALPVLRRELPVPVVGVLGAAVRAAVRAAQGRPVAVLGTEATIASGAYARAIRRRDPRVQVVSIACPLFVPLVEEGRTPRDPLVRLAVRDYLRPLRRGRVSVVVLACTHYPLLRPALRRQLGPQVRIVDSGRATARQVRRRLAAAGALSDPGATASMRCYVSDNPQRFARIGARFLGDGLAHVELVPTEALPEPWPAARPAAGRPGG